MTSTTVSDPTFTESWILGPQSTNFYTRLYPLSAPKAHIVFVHGFIEHIARYEHTFAGWAAHQISVFAFDQRGFGKTALGDQKSKTSAWGKTSWNDQMEDIAWFVLKERERLGPDVPIFLVGQSMGGGEVLGFATIPPVSQNALATISGIIALSPLIRQAAPAPKWKRWAGGKLALLAPAMLMDAEVNPKDLSRDPAVGEKFDKDPLIRQQGSLKGLSDMLAKGEELADKHYVNWPENLPVLILHGTDDKVTSHLASEKFIKDIKAKDKSVSLYPRGYHELHNEIDGQAQQIVDEVATWIEIRSATAPNHSQVSAGEGANAKL